MMASRCSPKVFKALRGHDLTLWTSYDEGITEVMEEFNNRPWCAIGGGATMGLRAMYLGYVMNYRSFHIFGLDSSFEDGDHAYEAPASKAGDVYIKAGAGRFRCKPWMAMQVQDFKIQSRKLVDQGCAIRVHGTGLLPHVVHMMANGPGSPNAVAAVDKTQATLAKLRGRQIANAAE